jgi:hypothetical protein
MNTLLWIRQVLLASWPGWSPAAAGIAIHGLKARVNASWRQTYSSG